MKLLLSEHALRTWGDRIKAAGDVIFVTAEKALADGAYDADIAFMTREVTGKSSSNNPTPELSGFDAVVRKSPGLKWLQIHPAGAERPIYRELRARGVKVTTASGAVSLTGLFNGVQVVSAVDTTGAFGLAGANSRGPVELG